MVQNVQAEDVNGDGSVDLVVESFHFQGPPPGQNEGATSRADHISFFLGNGNGTFQGEQIIATSRWRKATVFSPPVGDSIESLILGDYNGDGKLDLAYPRTRFFADRTRRTSLEIRLGKGDGTFSPIVALPGPGIILAAADLNSDKLSDLVVTGSGSDIGVVLNASPTSGADLGLVAAGASNDPAGVGTNLTYTAIVLNEGPQDATAVTFTDTLPNSANFISATTTQGSCSQSRGIVTCNIGVLASAYDATVTIVVTPMATRTITNTMNVTATAPDLDARDQRRAFGLHFA